MTIGERIKKRRLELHLSQSQLAERLGYKSKVSISNAENDRDDMTTSRIMKYADALETTPAYLMGWKDEDENIKRPISLSEFDEASKESQKTMYNPIFEQMGFHIERGIKSKERYYLETAVDEHGIYHRKVVVTEQDIDTLNKELDEYIYFKVSKLYEEKEKGAKDVKPAL